jgi:5-methylcytosine-specific restriction endonuclease McrA
MARKTVHSKNDMYYLYEKGIIIVNGVKRRRCNKCSSWYDVKQIGKELILNCDTCLRVELNKQKENERETDEMFSLTTMQKELEQFIEVNKEYYDDIKERRNEILRRAGQKYRALKRELPADLTEEQWIRCVAYFNHRCAYCGRKRKLAQEHIVPVDKGGGYTVENIVPSCKPCNSSKCNRDFNDWYSNHISYSPERERKITEYLRKAPS